MRAGLNDAGPRQPKKKKVIGQTSLKMNRTRGKPMTGFGVPGIPNAGITTFQRDLPPIAKAPPYFYFENVARAPKGVWQTMSRFLYEIEPEFVDSIYFTAAARKRGYIHNLPMDGRFQILPVPPSTIHETLPLTENWWPEWDDRTKFNCIVINNGRACHIKRIS